MTFTPYSDKITGTCVNCSEPVPPSKPREDGRGVKRRRFCSAPCRKKWWNDQRGKTGNPIGRPRTPGRGPRFWLYGLLEEDVEQMRQDQNYACAICLVAFDSDENVDHCHTTNQVRGLLCGRCNKGLGLFKDNPIRLRAAANYLEQGGGCGSAK